MGYYYGLRVYENLSSAGFRFKTFVQILMKVTMKTFLTWAKRVPEMAADRNMVPRAVWVVLGPFCVMCYVSYGRYMPEDEVLVSEKL